MNNTLVNRVRIERTQQQLDYLQTDFKAWYNRRTSTDRMQYATQLHTVSAIFSEALSAVGAILQGLNLDRPIGLVYEDCAIYSQVIIWLERIWQYTYEKFDQRDSDRFKSILKAADEVVWGCYHPVIAKVSDDRPDLCQLPMPMVYIEPGYSPLTRQRDKPLPNTLQLSDYLTARLNGNLEAVRDRLHSLPLPVIILPSWCVGSPWWLVYIAHEVGHHAMRDLSLVAYFENGFKEAARSRNLSDDLVQRIGAWSQEIFADLFSVAVMGPSATSALAEFLISSPAVMMIYREWYPYPPAAVRLLIMDRFAHRLGIAEPLDLPSLSLVELEQAVREAGYMEFVAAVVDFASEKLPDNLGTLASLCDWNKAAYERGDKVDSWRRHLLSGATPPKEPHSLSARYITGAALAAWIDVVARSDDAIRQKALTSLAEHTQFLLVRNAPAGRRDGSPGANVTGVGRELVELLAQAGRREISP